MSCSFSLLASNGRHSDSTSELTPDDTINTSWFPPRCLKHTQLATHSSYRSLFDPLSRESGVQTSRLERKRSYLDSVTHVRLETVRMLLSFLDNLGSFQWLDCHYFIYNTLSAILTLLNERYFNQTSHICFVGRKFWIDRFSGNKTVLEFEHVKSRELKLIEVCRQWIILEIVITEPTTMVQFRHLSTDKLLIFPIK